MHLPDSTSNLRPAWNWERVCDDAVGAWVLLPDDSDRDHTWLEGLSCTLFSRHNGQPSIYRPDKETIDSTKTLQDYPNLVEYLIIKTFLRTLSSTDVPSPLSSLWTASEPSRRTLVQLCPVSCTQVLAERVPSFLNVERVPSSSHLITNCSAPWSCYNDTAKMNTQAQ